MNLKARSLFELACYFVLSSLFFGQASANNIESDWATLPNNPLNTKCVTKHFSIPWPERIDLGTNGFLMAAKGEFAAHQVFEITPTGDCTFVFCDSSQESVSPIWRQISFKVSKVEVDNLISQIEISGVKNLKRFYGTRFDDGEQAFFSISDGRHLRSVWMDNFFPDEFRRIMLCIAQLINSQHLYLEHAPLSGPHVGHYYYHMAFPEGVNGASQ